MGNGSQIRLVFKLVSSQFAATWLGGVAGGGRLIYGTKESVGISKQESGTRGMSTNLMKLVGISSLALVSLPASPVLVSVLTRPETSTTFCPQFSGQQ